MGLTVEPEEIVSIEVRATFKDGVELD